MSKFNAVASGMRGSQKPAPDPVKETDATAKEAKKYDARSSGMRGNEPPKEETPAVEAKPEQEQGTQIHPGIHKFKNGRLMIDPAKFK